MFKGVYHGKQAHPGVQWCTPAVHANILLLLTCHENFGREIRSVGPKFSA